MYVSDQLCALHAMSPRSRVLQLMQWGVGRGDWEALQEIGEAATMEEANYQYYSPLAGKLKRWTAVATFVNGYSGLACMFRALDFISEEHEARSVRVNEQTEAGIGDVIRTHSQQLRFEEQYSILVGGHPNAEGWLRLMVDRVRERWEMLANSLASDSGATG